jgi:S1-C subfamily serine protease
MMRLGLMLAAAVVLTGCTTTANVGSQRVISVEADASPASAVLSPNMSNLVKRTSPSYVTLIVHESEQRGRSTIDILPEALTSGSGFVVDGAGHVVTAGHVGLKKGYSVDATGADGRLYRGKVVSVSRSPDMALIELADFSQPPVEPAPSPCMRPNQPVFSLGKPHAHGDTARIGTVESMSFGRPVSYSGFGYSDAIVLAMSTRKGESGGPVFDAEGELTAMLVSTLSDGNGRPLNLAHAISTPNIARFLCANTSCSPRWQALSHDSAKQCPAA